MTMTHGSLFSGIGGFDLAASWMGWKNAFHCEIDEFCSRVLKYHFPDSEHYGDIKTTDFTKWRGKVDVLSGGFPCQPFSVAGRRRGAEDDRYLWPEMLRAIREIQPTWVVGENVAGILTMVQPGEETPVAGESSIFGEGYEETEVRQRYVVETVCSDLEREGYSVQPLVIPACAVGAPHRRDRVWFIARRVVPDSADAGLEGLQRGRENGVHASGLSPDTDIDRRREREDKQVPVPEREGTPHDSICRKDGYASYADGERCDHGGDNRQTRQVRDHGERDVEESEPERDGREHRACEDSAAAADTRRARREELQHSQEPNETPATSRSDWEELPALRWAGFPTTQPVIRAGDDGISSRLDGITFPRWRTESIKAYGNAVVPQVVYEIFRAIEMTEKEA